MKNRIRRVCALLMALTVFVAFAISGCGSSESGSEESSAGEQEAEPVELLLWQHESTTQRVAAWQYVIDKFMEENPNIKVTQEVVLWEDQQSKMLNAIQTGTGPDMNAITGMTWTSSYLAGGLVAVDDVVERIDQSETYMEGAKEVFEADGHCWAVPFASIVYGLQYRPSMLEEAGLDAPPKTWDELLEYAEKLTVDKDGDGTIDVYGIGLPSGRNALTTDTYAAFLNAADGDLFDEAGDISFNNEASKKALDIYTELSKYAPEAASGWSWGEIEMNWAGGNLAMSPYHAPNLGAFFEAEDYDIAVTSFPGETEGAPQSIIYHGMTVTKMAEERGHMEAVEKFLEFMQTPEMNWVLTVGQEPGFFTPVTQTGLELMNSGYFNEEMFPLENFDYTEGSDHRKILENFYDVITAAADNGYMLGAKYGLVNLALSEIYNSNVIADMIQMTIVSGDSSEEAVEWAETRMEEIAE